MKDISDGICAYLRGGLGNQLFIIAAAWEQAQRLDCPLYVDISSFEHGDRLVGEHTQRTFALQALQLPFEIIDESSPWAFFSPARPRILRVANSYRRKLQVHKELSLEYDSSIHQIKPGTTLYGYFQSPKYFSGVAERLATTLDDVKLNEIESKSISTLVSSNFITIHLRRGDYLNLANQQFHGLVTADYIYKALTLLGNNNLLKPLVFSDSPEVAANELSQFNSSNFFEKNEGVGDFAELIAMSYGQSMVMSNSSYSWWSAWLGSQRGNMSKVIAPRPWFERSSNEKDLLLPDWLTLDRRETYLGSA